MKGLYRAMQQGLARRGQRLLAVRQFSFSEQPKSEDEPTPKSPKPDNDNKAPVPDQTRDDLNATPLPENKNKDKNFDQNLIGKQMNQENPPSKVLSNEPQPSLKSPQIKTAPSQPAQSLKKGASNLGKPQTNQQQNEKKQNFTKQVTIVQPRWDNKLQSPKLISLKKIGEQTSVEKPTTIVSPSNQQINVSKSVKKWHDALLEMKISKPQTESLGRVDFVEAFVEAQQSRSLPNTEVLELLDSVVKKLSSNDMQNAEAHLEKLVELLKTTPFQNFEVPLRTNLKALATYSGISEQLTPKITMVLANALDALTSGPLERQITELLRPDVLLIASDKQDNFSLLNKTLSHLKAQADQIAAHSPSGIIKNLDACLSSMWAVVGSDTGKEVTDNYRKIIWSILTTLSRLKFSSTEQFDRLHDSLFKLFKKIIQGAHEKHVDVTQLLSFESIVTFSLYIDAPAIWAVNLSFEPTEAGLDLLLSYIRGLSSELVQNFDSTFLLLTSDGALESQLSGGLLADDKASPNLISIHTQLTELLKPFDSRILTAKGNIMLSKAIFEKWKVRFDKGQKINNLSLPLFDLLARAAYQKADFDFFVLAHERVAQLKSSPLSSRIISHYFFCLMKLDLTAQAFSTVELKFPFFSKMNAFDKIRVRILLAGLIKQNHAARLYRQAVITPITTTLLPFKALAFVMFFESAFLQHRTPLLRYTERILNAATPEIAQNVLGPQSDEVSLLKFYNLVINKKQIPRNYGWTKKDAMLERFTTLVCRAKQEGRGLTVKELQEFERKYTPQLQNMLLNLLKQMQYQDEHIQGFNKRLKVFDLLKEKTRAISQKIFEKIEIKSEAVEQQQTDKSQSVKGRRQLSSVKSGSNKSNLITLKTLKQNKVFADELAPMLDEALKIAENTPPTSETVDPKAESFSNDFIFKTIKSMAKHRHKLNEKNFNKPIRDMIEFDSVLYPHFNIKTNDEKRPKLFQLLNTTRYFKADLGDDQTDVLSYLAVRKNQELAEHLGLLFFEFKLDDLHQLTHTFFHISNLEVANPVLRAKLNAFSVNQTVWPELTSQQVAEANDVARHPSLDAAKHYFQKNGNASALRYLETQQRVARAYENSLQPF